MSTRRRFGPATSVAVMVLLGSTAPALAPGRAAGPPDTGSPPARPPGPLAAYTRPTGLDSQNWAGYMARREPGSVTEVRARWTQPAVTCPSLDYQSASFWVGLSGGGPIQQTGTAAVCRGGRPEYYAWFEMYPAPLVEYNDPVEPGDELAARVTYIGENRFELYLHNATKKWTQIAYEQPPPGSEPTLKIAEVIAEAPGKAGGGVRPLADFGKVPFTRAHVVGEPINSSRHENVTMVSGDVVKAVTSPLTENGTAFTVTWKHD